MRRFRRVLLVLLAIVLAFVVLRRGASTGPSVKPGSVLRIDLEGQYVEEPSASLLDRLTESDRKPLPGLLTTLRKAERDSRIGTVLIRIRPLQLGWAKAQEIRDAISHVRESGRKVVAYLEIESFSGNLELYVASAADEVWMSPGARAPLVGLAAEYLFFGGLFEKLGVQLEVERIGKYKTAADTFSATGMSEAGAEMANALLDSIDAQFVKGLAERRGLSEADLRAAIDAAPMSPEEMQQRRLVDGVAYLDELLKKLGDPPVVKERDYANVDPTAIGFKPVATFAVVYGAGNVTLGEDSGPRGRTSLASDVVSKALLDAAEDPDVKAIVFRVDSPGGSALASDVIWRATQRAKEKGKPFIVSMSDLAASGGYYVSCGADAVIAEPGTFTGSIGVFVLRPVVGGLLEKLGVGVSALQRGAHADLLLGSRPLDPDTRARLSADVEGIYDLFVSRVAEGRHLTKEQVNEIGRGRVWTGEQALGIGLVDELGGLRAAVDLAKEKSGLERTADVLLKPFPEPKPFAEQIREALTGSAAQATSAALPLPGVARELVEWLSTTPEGAPVLLPPVSIRIH